MGARALDWVENLTRQASEMEDPDDREAALFMAGCTTAVVVALADVEEKLAELKSEIVEGITRV